MERTEESSRGTSLQIGLFDYVSRAVSDTSTVSHEMDIRRNLATSHLRPTMERRPDQEVETSRVTRVSEEGLYREPVTGNDTRPNENQHASRLQRRNRSESDSQDRSIRERGRNEATEATSTHRPNPRYTQIGMRSAVLQSRRVLNSSESETREIPSIPSEMGTSMARTGSMADGTRQPKNTKSELVIASFNCEGWDDVITENLLTSLSCNNEKNVALFCQETWLYAIPAAFNRKISKLYNIIHVSAMDPSKPKSAGRPFGGLAAIVSKNIAYKCVYENNRCLSILFIDYDLLVNNVYMPFSDSRVSSSTNVERYMEALGHLDAAHELAEDAEYRITLGDLNSDPKDRNDRAEALALWLNEQSYEDTDLFWLPESDATHKSGRIIDRIVTSRTLLSSISNIHVERSFLNSDHFPIVCEMRTPVTLPPVDKRSVNKRLNWKGASKQALEAYAKLCNKTCKSDLQKFRSGKLNGQQLYEKLVSNLESAANTCIPKTKEHGVKSHNIPFWRQRMSAHQTTVDYWLQTQFLQGGANRCHPHVREQLRVARAQYKRQHRTLRREIRENIANHTTVKNCFNVLFKPSKKSPPSCINGKSRDEQPVMWREHFKRVFKAEDTPFTNDLLESIDFTSNCGTNTDSHFSFQIDEILSAIHDIDTDKSYFRHHHWKTLLTFNNNHFAFLCLRFI